jgi:ABC-type polar amino acid transport system ATPase subunit
VTLDQRVQQLRHELEDTRRMVAIVIGAYNSFTHQTFFQRLRWVVLGPPRAKKEQANG